MKDSSTVPPRMVPWRRRDSLVVVCTLLGLVIVLGPLAYGIYRKGWDARAAREFYQVAKAIAAAAKANDGVYPPDLSVLRLEQQRFRLLRLDQLVYRVPPPNCFDRRVLLYWPQQRMCVLASGEWSGCTGCSRAEVFLLRGSDDRR